MLFCTSRNGTTSRTAALQRLKEGAYAGAFFNSGRPRRLGQSSRSSEGTGIGAPREGGHGLDAHEDRHAEAIDRRSDRRLEEGEALGSGRIHAACRTPAVLSTELPRQPGLQEVFVFVTP